MPTNYGSSTVVGLYKFNPQPLLKPEASHVWGFPKIGDSNIVP